MAIVIPNGRLYGHCPTPTPATPGPTFAISLTPLTSACWRAEATTLLTLSSSLVDGTGLGAAHFFSNGCEGQTREGHRGWCAPSLQTSRINNGVHCLHSEAARLTREDWMKGVEGQARWRLVL